MSDIPAYQQRVLDEYQELCGRLERLGAFIENGVFKTLDQDERTLLMLQRDQMRALSLTLQMRIRKMRIG